MAYVTYIPQIPLTEIDPDLLQHSYYVKLAPDGSHLVPGLIQQEAKPNIGHWLQLGQITRDFPVRYFVQYTDFNTLVPGSLIQADQFPDGQWKEVKKPSLTLFNRIVTNGGININSYDLVTESPMLGTILFVDYYLLPALDLIQPGVYSSFQPATVELYYFAGNFQALNNDAAQLEPMSQTGSYFSAYIDALGVKTPTITTNTVTIYDDLLVSPSAPDGMYSLVVKLPPHGTTPAFYIVFENLIRKTYFLPG